MRIRKIPVAIAGGVLAVAAALVPAGTASAASTTSGSDKGASTESYSCGYYSGTTTTRYGDTGNRVKEVQCLINLGYYPYHLTVDGIFGDGTLAGVKWYQRCAGITVDGIVGPNTWYQLRNNPNC